MSRVTEPVMGHASSVAANLPTSDVLGYRVARCTLEGAASWALGTARQPNTSKLLVTLNPEIVVQADTDPELKAALHGAELTVADGVGITWAARRAGTPLPERVPGVELMTRILERGGAELRVYFLGAKPGVAGRAAETARERYGTIVAGTQHGYFKRPDDVAGVINTISKSGADVLLAGLGEGQELFLHQHRAALGVPLLMGVGGALDVLSGEVERTPAWTRRVGLEWAYRVGFDPQRWHRVPRLIRFVKAVALSHR